MTGPLDVEPIVLRIPRPVPVDPLDAPPCRDIFVTSTAQFSDPRASSAVVRGQGQATGSVRRVGDFVGSAQVAFIGFNAVDATPAVWFNLDGSVCQVQLFRAPIPPTAKKPAAPPPVRRKRSRWRASSPGLPQDLARRIERVSATSVRVERGIVDDLITGYAKYMKGVRIRPVERAGRVVGMRLARIASNGLLAHLGFRQDDRIESINGFRLTGPEAALGAYARLRTASDLRIGIRRGDRPLTLEVAIR